MVLRRFYDKRTKPQELPNGQQYADVFWVGFSWGYNPGPPSDP